MGVWPLLLLTVVDCWPLLIVDHCCLYSYANIVGVLGEIPTFTLSPPGLFYGIKKFGIDNAADLYPYITALVPDMDLVSGWWVVV